MPFLTVFILMIEIFPRKFGEYLFRTRLLLVVDRGRLMLENSTRYLFIAALDDPDFYGVIIVQHPSDTVYSILHKVFGVHKD